MNKDRKLLEKLYHASERLSDGFITLLINSPSCNSGMEGEIYDEIMDIFIEVADYLGVDD